MKTIKTLARLAATASLALTMLAVNSGLASAQSGSIGFRYDFGANCTFNRLHVNEPKVRAFDATTGVDTQTVYWLSEIWRLDEATGAFTFVTTYSAWSASVVDDGTQSDTMTLGGGQDFDIFLSGTYRVAIRYVWEATPVTAGGEVYEWISQYNMTDWQWVLGTYISPADACIFGF